MREPKQMVCVLFLLALAAAAQAAEKAEVPEQLVSGFIDAVAIEDPELLAPFVTAASRGLVRKERGFLGELRKIYIPEVDQDYVVERTRSGLRVDFLPLMRFHPALYFVEEKGTLKVDLLKVAMNVLLGRPKDEIVSICKRSVEGVVDPERVDLYETDHFLLLAYTGPLPAKKTQELLEELYVEFERSFPIPARGVPPRMRGTYPHLVVFLFDTAEAYQAFTRKYDPGMDRTAGHASALGYMGT